MKAPAAVSAALLLLIAAAGCGSASPRTGSAHTPPSIVLVVADALRWDRLGCYGRRPSLTAHLDALAAQGLLFERAYAASSWTKPSVPSILTGLAPAAHGVYEGAAPGADGRWHADRLPEEADTLAERLRQAGYATAAFVHNAHLGPASGLAQGFEVYEHDAGPAPELLERARAWVEAVASGPRPRAFFLWVHLLDAHWPYDPPADAARAVGLSLPLEPLPANLPEAVNRALLELDAPALQALERRYDAEVLALDGTLGRFIAALEARAGAASVLWAVTADHGEAFLEHGRLGHGGDLYEETVRVPLLLRLPGLRFAGQRVEGPVSLADLAPTLLEAAGLEAGSERSLLRRLLGAPETGAAVLAEVRHGADAVEALWHGEWKLIRRTREAPPALESLGETRAAIGWRAKAEGRFVALGRFRAEAFELDEPSDRDLELEGILEALDRRQARVAGVFFQLDEDLLWLDEKRELVSPAAFRPGKAVKADLEWRPGGALVAEKLTLRERPRVRVEGIVRGAQRAGGQARLDIGPWQVEVPVAVLEEAAVELSTRRASPSPVTRLELYDLRADPRETRDLAGEDPERVGILAAMLERTLEAERSRALARTPAQALDEATVRSLRALGYVP